METRLKTTRDECCYCVLLIRLLRKQSIQDRKSFIVCVFTPINTRHKYNTRLASKSTFVFPIIRTNYGRFNIRFFGPKVWNEIEEPLKSLSFGCFKRELKTQLLRKYIIA